MFLCEKLPADTIVGVRVVTIRPVHPELAVRRIPVRVRHVATGSQRTSSRPTNHIEMLRKLEFASFGFVVLMHPSNERVEPDPLADGDEWDFLRDRLVVRQATVLIRFDARADEYDRRLIYCSEIFLAHHQGVEIITALPFWPKVKIEALLISNTRWTDDRPVVARKLTNRKFDFTICERLALFFPETDKAPVEVLQVVGRENWDRGNLGYNFFLPASFLCTHLIFRPDKLAI